MEDLTTAQVISYGLQEDNLVTASGIQSKNETVFFNLTIEDKDEDYKIKLPIPGKYNVYNALAAISVGLVLDITIDKIKVGLAELKLTAMRNQISTSESGFKIINDTYNANPTSMRAALNTLVEVATKNKIAVLGNMLELGSIANQEHNKLGHLVADKEIDYLITIGNLGLEIAKGAKQAGMNENQIFSYQKNEPAIEKILRLITSGDTILIKASRGMRLEQVSQALQDK